jgi:hypothetical protein
MAAVQLGLWTLLEKYGIPLLNKAIVGVMETFGVSEDVAKKIVANKVLVAFEEVGVFALSLKTKLPVKVAELLGFTTRGFVKATLTEAVESKIAGKVVTATSKAATTAEEAGAISKTVAVAKGLSLTKINTVLSVLAKVIGIPVGVFYALAQYIDYAAWQNPFQKFFQGIMGFIGIHPDTPLPKSGVVSDDTWKRIYSTVEQWKPVGMTFPLSGVDKPYSRKNLVDLVDEVAAHIVKAGGDATYKNVIGAMMSLLQFNGEEPQPAVFATLATSSTPTTTTPEVQVLTGIVSNGVLGNGLQFTARQDDMIENAEELRDAFNNNVAPFLVSLPSLIIWEIRLVTSIISRDGFKQTGGVVKIQTGTNKDGTPKTKTITNRFAVLDLYIKTDKSARTKITSITLGPVNSSQFNPSASDLQNIAASAAKGIVAPSLDSVHTVASNTPTASVPVHEPDPVYFVAEAPNRTFPLPPGATTPEFMRASNGKGGFINAEKTDMQDLLGAGNDVYSIYKIVIDQYRFDGAPTINSQIVEWAKNVTPYEADQMRVFYRGGTPVIAKPVVVVEPVVVPPPPPVISTTLPVAAQQANTLFEFYGALGQQLPNLDTRSRLYQSLELGQATLYTGTAEQNTRLLAALKTKGI